MKRYKINEIFYSIQGEGINSGCPAVFVRFSGCNLACPFCDTDHNDGKFMSIDEILTESGRYSCRFMVLTGGEPSLFADDSLLSAVHDAGYTIAIETNGTHALPNGIDHITLSPKDDFCDNAVPVIEKCDELKVVYTGANNPLKYDRIEARQRVIQPCDTGDETLNARLVTESIDFCLRNPQWRLSMQLHKILNVR